jgi:hypothetical protein
MAGEDLLEDDTGTSSTSSTDGPDGKKKKKPLSKGQKIGVAIGLVTIVLFIYEIEKNKSAAATAGASTTSTPVDPQTGYPQGSAEDTAALAAMNGSGSGSGYYGGGSSDGYGSVSTSSGIDPTTGATYASEMGTDPSTGISYSSELASSGTALSTLGTEYSTLQGQFTTLESTLPGGANYVAPVTPATTSKTANPSVLQSANLAKLNQELGKDQAAKKPNTKAIATLKKQITAVTNRS